MSRLPKISIITPSYNQGQYIEQTIDSVLSQNYQNLEYIIIDGGSTDNTVEIIKKYEKHLKYWDSEPDRGQSHAINKGFKHASGDIINWLNSDDWYEPELFNTLSELARQHPDKNVFAFSENHIFENGAHKVHPGTPLFNNLGEYIFYSELDQPPTFFKKKVWDALFPLKEELHYVMDGELWVRYLLHFGTHGILKTEQPAVNFRIHANSKTTQNQDNQGFLLDRAAIVLSVLSASNVPKILINKVHDYYFQNAEPTPYSANYSLTPKQQKEILRYFMRKTIITAKGKNETKVVIELSRFLLKKGWELTFAISNFLNKK